MIIDRLNRRVAELRNPSIVGLDTHLMLLPAAMAERVDHADPMGSAAALILEFNKGLVDAIADIVPCVKVQVAYYEQYGWEYVGPAYTFDGHSARLYRHPVAK